MEIMYVNIFNLIEFQKLQNFLQIVLNSLELNFLAC